MADIVIPEIVINAGLVEAKRIAENKGYGWEFGMLPQSELAEILSAVYKVMRAAELKEAAKNEPTN